MVLTSVTRAWPDRGKAEGTEVTANAIVPTNIPSPTESVSCRRSSLSSSNAASRADRSALELPPIRSPAAVPADGASYGNAADIHNHDQEARGARVRHFEGSDPEFGLGCDVHRPLRRRPRGHGRGTAPPVPAQGPAGLRAGDPHRRRVARADEDQTGGGRTWRSEFRSGARDRWAASVTGGDMNTAIPVMDCFRKLEGRIRGRWEGAPQRCKK